MVALNGTQSKSLAEAKHEIHRAQESLDNALSLMANGFPAGAALACDNTVRSLREAQALLFAEVNNQGLLADTGAGDSVEAFRG